MATHSVNKEAQEQGEFPEEHPDVKPGEATYLAIAGFLMNEIGHPHIRITARTLREWRLRGVRITMQPNGSAILTKGD